jgi:4-amino-4-deoxy-L-arabinose transferase-like glycosyltransferase
MSALRTRASVGRRAWWPAAAIFALALAVRLVYNLTAARQYTPIFDAALYDILARHLASGRCYCIYGPLVSVSRAPLWPWIMAAIYSLLGPQNLYARLFLCLLGSCTCLLVYRLAGDLFGQRAGLLAGIVAAVYTGLFLDDGWLYTESLYTFCVTAFTYALYRLTTDAPRERPRGGGWRAAPWHWVRAHRWAILCGLFAGAASLTRPNGVLLVGVLGAWAIILIIAKAKPWRAALRSALIGVVLAVALVAPWTARNYAVAHAFIPVETGTGEVLLGAYNDRVVSGVRAGRGFWSPPLGMLNHDEPGYTPQTDSQYTARALAWMGSHLSTMPYLLGLHFSNMWRPYTYSLGLPIEEHPDTLAAKIIQVMIPLESLPIFLLAAAGMLGTLITWRRWWRALLPVYLVLAAAIAQNVAVYGSMRFRAPIEPLLVVLASGAVVSGAPVLRRTSARLAGRIARWRTVGSGPVAVGERAADE